MTLSDLPRWTEAVRRLCVCYDKPLSTEQRDAWFDQLERYPMEAVEQAFRDAPAEAGRFFPNIGLLEQLTRKALAGTVRTTGDWHAPDVARDPDTGLVVARWRCVFCEDTGWRAQVTDGPLLTTAELVDPAMGDRLRVPREDGRPTYVMQRCACRARKAAAA
jgi:hypothetical protein